MDFLLFSFSFFLFRSCLLTVVGGWGKPVNYFLLVKKLFYIEFNLGKELFLDLTQPLINRLRILKNQMLLHFLGEI